MISGTAHYLPRSAKEAAIAVSGDEVTAKGGSGWSDASSFSLAREAMVPSSGDGGEVNKDLLKDY